MNKAFVRELDAPPGHAYPKFRDGWICSCLGIPVGVIRAEAQAGSREQTLRIIEAGRAKDAACPERSPDGRSCARRVREVFLEASE